MKRLSWAQLEEALTIIKSYNSNSLVTYPPDPSTMRIEDLRRLQSLGIYNPGSRKLWNSIKIINKPTIKGK